MVLLDGVLIAARREVFTAVPFDAKTFDDFHLYDIDWSYRAANAGFRLGVAGELLLPHESRGAYGDAWQYYAERFCLKHAAGRLAPRPSSFFVTTLDTSDQVRAFFRFMVKLHHDR